MKSNSAGDKRVKRYATIFVIVVVAILAADIACTYYYENYIVRIGISRFEKIEIKSASVIKSTYVYYVTINFTNTGASSTSIASVLLNDTPYNDSGWVGTVKPAVAGDLALKFIIDVDASNMGVIIFSDDCEYLPSGYRLMAGETVKITIYTTGDKDYGTSIMLPGSASTNNLEVNTLGTVLTLSIPSTAMQYIPVTLKATLKDVDGNPIQDAMIHFGPLFICLSTHVSLMSMSAFFPNTAVLIRELLPIHMKERKVGLNIRQSAASKSRRSKEGP